MKPEHDEALVEQRLLNFTTCGCGDDEWPQLRRDVLALIRTTDAARIADLEAALRTAKEAIDEYQRYWFGGEMRGSYDGKPERAQLWAAGHAARATLRSSPDAV